MKMKKPLVIGIVGGSGSGKTTVTKRVIEELSQDKVVLIEQDYYYKNQDHLTMEERVKTNYDHPDAFDNDLLAQHLQELIQGREVDMPIYDYVNHTRSSETKHQESKEVIILEGLFGLYSKTLREQLDIKIFVDTPSDIRILRRLLRDMKERGRSVESVISQYLTSVRPMHEQYIQPTRQYADIVIPDGGYNDIAVDILLTKIKSILEK
ncbi:uridine kinase [Gemella sp. WT2a]|nr:uridine kinase [Gemella sp. WT2a]